MPVYLHYKHLNVKNLSFKTQRQNEGARAQSGYRIRELIALLYKRVAHTEACFHFNSKLKIRQEEIESPTRIQRHVGLLKFDYNFSCDCFIHVLLRLHIDAVTSAE